MNQIKIYFLLVLNVCIYCSSYSQQNKELKARFQSVMNGLNVSYSSICDEQSFLSALKANGRSDTMFNQLTLKLDTLNIITFHLGSLVKCDSVISPKGLINIYLSSPIGEIDKNLLKLMAKSSIEDYKGEGIYSFASNLLQVILSKIAFLSDHDIGKIFIYIGHKKEEVIFFDKEPIYEELSTGQNQNYRRIIGDQIFDPCYAYVYHEENISDARMSTGGLTKEEEELYANIAKNKIVNYVRANFFRTGNEFTYNGSEQFTFRMKNGPILNSNTKWEYIQLVLTYKPFSKKSGSLICVFDGYYKSSSPYGNGPSREVIVHDGIDLEKEYKPQIDNFIAILFAGLKATINK